MRRQAVLLLTTSVAPALRKEKKPATMHTHFTEVTHVDDRISHRWPAIGAEGSW
jgi:hypothetical protein